MKPLIVGEAPSKNEDPPTPISGRIGKRLAACAGLTLEEFLERFERVNLLQVRQDTKEKGFEFDLPAAIESGRLLVERIEPGRTVILLGKRVADAVGCAKDYFEPHRLRNGATLYVVPHPSGVNRWYNEPTNALRMARFMRNVVDWTNV